MPQSALSHVNVDYCVPLADIAPLLIELTRRIATAPALPAQSAKTNSPSAPTTPVI
jgi:hypothetical protein